MDCISEVQVTCARPPDLREGSAEDPGAELSIGERVGFRCMSSASGLGNSAPIAAKHYLQVTEDHFREAAQKAAQNPAQQAAAAGGTDSQTRNGNPKKTPGIAAYFCPLRGNARWTGTP